MKRPPDRLLPFLVVLRVGGWWIAAYLVADVCAVVGFFRNYLTYAHTMSVPYASAPM